MAVRFVLERTVKIKTGYVNPKLGFWFAAALSNPSCIPLCRVLTVAKIATQLLAYVTIIICLSNTAARGDSSKEAMATHPFPSKASGDGDARSSEISKHLVLSLVASLRLPSSEKLVRIFGCLCISANSQQLNTQLEFVRLLKAYKQSSVGTLFCLTLEAIDVGVKKTCFAKILRNASENCRLELESFQLVPNKTET
ncbi:hypothetical protein ACSBR2_028879 [Camellia fascicularis]